MTHPHSLIIRQVQWQFALRQNTLRAILASIAALLSMLAYFYMSYEQQTIHVKEREAVFSLYHLYEEAVTADSIRQLMGKLEIFEDQFNTIIDSEGIIVSVTNDTLETIKTWRDENLVEQRKINTYLRDLNTKMDAVLGKMDTMNSELEDLNCAVHTCAHPKTYPDHAASIAAMYLYELYVESSLDNLNTSNLIVFDSRYLHPIGAFLVSPNNYYACLKNVAPDVIFCSDNCWGLDCSGNPAPAGVIDFCSDGCIGTEQDIYIQAYSFDPAVIPRTLPPLDIDLSNFTSAVKIEDYEYLFGIRGWTVLTVGTTSSSVRNCRIISKISGIINKYEFDCGQQNSSATFLLLPMLIVRESNSCQDFTSGVTVDCHTMNAVDPIIRSFTKALTNIDMKNFSFQITDQNYDAGVIDYTMPWDMNILPNPITSAFSSVYWVNFSLVLHTDIVTSATPFRVMGPARP